MFGYEKKWRSEKEVRKSMTREKEVKNRIDFVYYLI